MKFNRFFADVSAFQPDVNMHDYADAGHLAIAIKATEGQSYVNPHHRGQALSAGLRHVAVIHYHFARPDEHPDPLGEVQHFLSVALPLAGPRDYLVCDLERATPQGWSHDPAWSRQFDKDLRERCRFRTILYASRSVLQQSDLWLDGDPKRVWDAAYSSEPDFAPAGYECIFRQYTDGVVGPEPRAFAGIGHCDGNYMNRQTFAHLIAGRS